MIQVKNTPSFSLKPEWEDLFSGKVKLDKTAKFAIGHGVFSRDLVVVIWFEDPTKQAISIGAETFRAFYENNAVAPHPIFDQIQLALKLHGD